MEDIERLTKWNQQLSLLLVEQDFTKIADSLMAAMAVLVESDHRSIAVCTADHQPIYIHETSVENWPDEDVKNYLGGAYLLDPFYRSGIACIEPGLYRFDELAPRAFRESEYYKMYYSSAPIEDEICFITYLKNGFFAITEFIRTDGSPGFSEREVALAKTALPVIESTLYRYWLAAEPTYRDSGSILFRQLEAALGVFGTSQLTGREAEVIRLYLYGHDTRSISERLDISPHTVAAHRRNSYARLDITSQSELFSLFLSSMYCFDSEALSDPLGVYLKQKA